MTTIKVHLTENHKTDSDIIIHSQLRIIDLTNKYTTINHDYLKIDIRVDNIISLKAHFYLALDRDEFPDLMPDLSKYRLIKLPFDAYYFIFDSFSPSFLLGIRFDVNILKDIINAYYSSKKEKEAKQKKLLPDLIKLKKQK